MSSSGLTAWEILPADGCRGALVGRVWRPDAAGPSVVAIRADSVGEARVVDITAAFPTVSDLCEARDPGSALRGAAGEDLASLDAILANTPPDDRDPARPWLLAPVDLQALKAAGVTFATSMLEGSSRSAPGAISPPLRRSVPRSSAWSATTCVG